MVLHLTPQRGAPWSSYADFMSGVPDDLAFALLPPPAEPTTYAVLRGGYIKIGRTGANIEPRLRQLARPGNVLCPPDMDETEPLVLLHRLVGDREGRLHAELRDHHVKGEWFHDCAAVRAALTREETL